MESSSWLVEKRNSLAEEGNVFVEVLLPLRTGCDAYHTEVGASGVVPTESGLS